MAGEGDSRPPGPVFAGESEALFCHFVPVLADTDGALTIRQVLHLRAWCAWQPWEVGDVLILTLNRGNGGTEHLDELPLQVTP